MNDYYDVNLKFVDLANHLIKDFEFHQVDIAYQKSWQMCSSHLVQAGLCI